MLVQLFKKCRKFPDNTSEKAQLIFTSKTSDKIGSVYELCTIYVEHQLQNLALESIKLINASKTADNDVPKYKEEFLKNQTARKIFFKKCSNARLKQKK